MEVVNINIQSKDIIEHIQEVKKLLEGTNIPYEEYVQAERNDILSQLNLK